MANLAQGPLNKYAVLSFWTRLRGVWRSRRTLWTFL